MRRHQRGGRGPSRNSRRRDTNRHRKGRERRGEPLASARRTFFSHDARGRRLIGDGWVARAIIDGRGRAVDFVLRGYRSEEGGNFAENRM